MTASMQSHHDCLTYLGMSFRSHFLSVAQVVTLLHSQTFRVPIAGFDEVMSPGAMIL
jgi:hypothetical protein